MLIFIGYVMTLKFKGEYSLNREGNTTITKLYKTNIKIRYFQLQNLEALTIQ